MGRIQRALHILAVRKGLKLKNLVVCGLNVCHVYGTDEIKQENKVE